MASQVGGLLARLSPGPPVRYALIFALDALIALGSLYTALLLRFDVWAVPSEQLRTFFYSAPLLVGIRLVTGAIARLHQWSFRMSGLHEAVRLALTTAVGTFCFVAVVFFLRLPMLPRSVIVLEYFFTTALMALYRYLPRVASGWYVEQSRSQRPVSERTLIVGAGSAGDLLLRDLERSENHNYHVVGFIDDNPRKLGTRLGGKPVLGDVARLPEIVNKHRVSKVLIAIPRLPGGRVREILSQCANQKVSFKIMPASFTYMDERITAAMLHDLSPLDLLPRESVSFESAELRGHVMGRRILITGAAGSIGSEIARQVAAQEPERLVLVDINENELYFLVRSLQVKHPDLDVRAQIADIRDAEKMLLLGELHRPAYVFHAAAHKHVPLMEDAPEEAIKNNVFGTQNVARMADACGAEKFVLISTDKAVRPSSVMGATKRIAEYVVRDLARTSRTHFTAVRFGNVLGSAGSVVPLFKLQIERGGPVTVTHPECRRYFMTIPEAVGLVLIAGLGRYGELCVLDMGEPIKIDSLARNMITMSGLVPDVDVKIVYTGLRPGEKLTEELLTEEEEQSQVVRNKIFVATSPAPPADLHVLLDRLQQAALSAEREAILGAMQDIVATFQPQGQEKTAVPGAMLRVV